MTDLTREKPTKAEMENYDFRHLFRELFEIISETNIMFSYKQAVALHRIMQELEEKEVDYQ